MEDSCSWLKDENEALTSLVSSTVSSSRLSTASVSIVTWGRKRLLVCGKQRWSEPWKVGVFPVAHGHSLMVLSFGNTYFLSAICDNKRHWHRWPFAPVRGWLLTVPQDDDLQSVRYEKTWSRFTSLLYIPVVSPTYCTLRL